MANDEGEGMLSTACVRPSLFLACRLASIVQKFKNRLRQKVPRRRGALTPFGVSYYRGTRLRAVSDLERYGRRGPLPVETLADRGEIFRVTIPPRRHSITTHPESDVRHGQHAQWIGRLLHDLDGRTNSHVVPLTAVAADERLLFSQSPETLVESLTERISLHQVAYLFDLSTFLIHRLEVLDGERGRQSPDGAPHDAASRRLRDEKYIANLLHLLRRLQHFLFQILVRRSIKWLDEIHDHWQKRDWAHQGTKLDDDWFSEWPSGRRPLSTTWPWNIRPSLVVLWVSGHDSDGVTRH